MPTISWKQRKYNINIHMYNYYCKRLRHDMIKSKTKTSLYNFILSGVLRSCSLSIKMKFLSDWAHLTIWHVFNVLRFWQTTFLYIFIYRSKYCNYHWIENQNFFQTTHRVVFRKIIIYIMSRLEKYRIFCHFSTNLDLWHLTLFLMQFQRDWLFYIFKKSITRIVMLICL